METDLEAAAEAGGQDLQLLTQAKRSLKRSFSSCQAPTAPSCHHSYPKKPQGALSLSAAPPALAPGAFQPGVLLGLQMSMPDRTPGSMLTLLASVELSGVSPWRGITHERPKSMIFPWTHVALASQPQPSNLLFPLASQLVLAFLTNSLNTLSN